MLVPLNAKIPVLVLVNDPPEPLMIPLNVKVVPEETSIVLPELTVTAFVAVTVAVPCNVPKAPIAMVPVPKPLALFVLTVPAEIAVPPV